MNTEYEIRYFRLLLCRSYLKRYFHPLFLRTFDCFDCIEPFAGKADLFRYLVVYREGGFYSDWKQECKLEGLLNWISQENATFFATWDKHWSPRKPLPLANAFFGATPRSPVLAEAIRVVLQNTRMRQDLKVGLNVYDMTFIPLGDAFTRFETGWTIGKSVKGTSIIPGGKDFFMDARVLTRNLLFYISVKHVERIKHGVTGTIIYRRIFVVKSMALGNVLTYNSTHGLIGRNK